MDKEKLYEAIKKETSIQCYKIVKEQANDLSIFESKFGGYPYWDLSKEVPVDSKNEKMCLLAQINFDKEKLNDERLPQKGILQFYISVNDDVYGMDFDNQDKQEDWRVIYHENVNYDITEEMIKGSGIKSFKEVSSNQYVPFNEEYRIKFTLSEDIIAYSSPEFNETVSKILDNKFNILVKESEVSDYLDELDEKFYKRFSAWGHKLLGYPEFTQSDPRYNYIKYFKYDTLLLQIDSEGEIMWGDSGVANFFINKEDLLNRNFNNILYNWDCY